MNPQKNPYKNFPKFVLRTPLLPLNYFEELTSKELITDAQIKNVFNNPVISEAIFLASPSLHEEALKWVKGDKKDDKLKYALLKYISRMSSRCTPFGLFAGCALGEFGETTHIKLKSASEHKRHTRLDMNYLVALSQDLLNSKEIREQLLFYPNSSIYEIGDNLRYVEYTYKNSNRQHHIIAVSNSDYLQRVLDLAKKGKGAYLKDLIDELIDDEITREDATEFIEELIVNQLIVSELEPSISGPEFLNQILDVLKKIKKTAGIIAVINESNAKIKTIDKSIGNISSCYIELSEHLKQIDTTFELKFLFQTDMELNCSKNTLDHSIIASVKKGIFILNKITFPPRETMLSKFRNAFYERYEEREVLLANALDIEIGIGYRQNEGTGDVNPLVDDLILPADNTDGQTGEVPWNAFNRLVQKKLIEAFKKNSYTIVFKDDDFKDFNQGWEDLPDTMSSMIEILMVDGKEKIRFSGLGGSSAANLLARFCHGNDALKEYTQSIVDTETDMHQEKILAEIVHLPESRVGNILMRPLFRKYEIPYLAKSVIDKTNQLSLDDLTISVKNNRKIILRSKKNNKEVLPRLTNAHNYSANSLPIYHFLADMQTQGLRSGVSFNLGPFANDYEFIPRIEYENLILHEATWNIKKKDIEVLLNAMNDDIALKSALTPFLSIRKIPSHVLLVDGDNRLLINFKNLTSTRMLLDFVKKREHFTITEFLFDKSSVVTGKDGYYTNQIILSFYNQNRLTTQKPKN